MGYLISNMCMFEVVPVVAIFLGLLEVTDPTSGPSSLANAGTAEGFQEITPAYRPLASTGAKIRGMHAEPH
jgi:hypothetical protein